MGELQFPGMQEMALEVVAFPIERVSRNRMAEMLEMNADLVGASCARHAGDK
jgi:hypothetical protein